MVRMLKATSSSPQISNVGISIVGKERCLRLDRSARYQLSIAVAPPGRAALRRYTSRASGGNREGSLQLLKIIFAARLRTIASGRNGSWKNNIYQDIINCGGRF